MKCMHMAQSFCIANANCTQQSCTRYVVTAYAGADAGVQDDPRDGAGCVWEGQSVSHLPSNAPPRFALYSVTCKPLH